MIKQIFLLIVLSAAAIFFQDQLADLLNVFVCVHHAIAKGLGLIFSLSTAGKFVQSVLALLFVPALLGILIAVAHFFIRQKSFSYTMTVVWICWAFFLAAVLLERGRLTSQDVSIHDQSAVPSAVSGITSDVSKDVSSISSNQNQ